MNNIEVENLIFNFGSLNKRIKKLGYEIKTVWSNLIFAMFMLFCVFMIIAAGLFVFLLNYSNIKCFWFLVFVDAFVFISGIIFLAIGINTRNKLDKSSKYIELQKKQIAARKMYIERLLYSFMDDSYNLDSIVISEEQLPDKRASIRTTPFAFEKTEYLINKFNAELQFLAKKEKSVIDISIIVVLITAGLDMVKEVTSLWLQLTPERITEEIIKALGTTAGSVIAFVFICFIVYLISEWTSTSKITYRTQMRNIEYTINVLNEIRRGIPNNTKENHPEDNDVEQIETSDSTDDSCTSDTLENSESDDSVDVQKPEKE